MQFVPLRLAPGADLRRALEESARTQSTGSAFVVAGIGSLVSARLRYAGESTETQLAGPLEILSLSGSLSGSGAHLHVSVSDASGRVCGGHLGYGSAIRTTAEVLLACLPDWWLTREPDAATGFNELVVRRRE
jgi:predicted DNA-binding protein with PD1-like motif